MKALVVYTSAFIIFGYMKKIIILLLFAAGAWVASAQSFNFGVKAGVNVSSLSTNVTGVKEGDAQTAFVGGLFSRIGFLGFYVEPGLLYSQRKGNFDLGGGQSTTISLDYIDIPVMLGYKLLFARAYIGPNFQFLVNASQSGTTDPNFSKNNFNNAGVGFQAGIGADAGRFTFDIRYDGCFTDLGKKVTDEVTGQQLDYSTTASMWQFTIGYKFIKL
jgi:hypothetical protein